MLGITVPLVNVPTSDTLAMIRIIETMDWNDIVLKSDFVSAMPNGPH